MKKSKLMVPVIALGAAISLTNCQPSSNVKIGLICLNTKENSSYDANFIDAFIEACKKKNLKENTNYFIRTNVPEDTACQEKAEELAKLGANFIFSDSFGHEQHMFETSKLYPETHFVSATGCTAKTNKQSNFSNAFAKIHQGRYLSGYIAGKYLTKTNPNDKNIKVGYVAALDENSEVRSGFSAFYLGVKAAVPTNVTVTMDVKFTGTWHDVPLEEEYANDLITAECKLISQHADSIGAPKACQDHNIPNVGYNISYKSKYETTLCATKINWEPYFENIIDKLENKETIPTDYCGSLSDNCVQILDCPDEFKEEVETIRKELIDGKRFVFDASTFKARLNKKTGDYKSIDQLGIKFGDYNPIKEATVGGKTVKYFSESNADEYMSAPCCNFFIEGINFLN